MKDDLIDYIAAMAQAKAMLEKGIISSDDYSTIETLMARKYGLGDRSIFRQYLLTPGPGRVSNMIRKTEVADVNNKDHQQESA